MIVGTAHSCVGQEAIAVGAAGVMREGDYLVGDHRSQRHLIAAGADLRRMMAEMFGSDGLLQAAQRAAGHEPELRGLVDDLVEGDRGEVGELELDHGTEAGERGADPQPTKPLSVSGVSRIRSAP